MTLRCGERVLVEMITARALPSLRGYCPARIVSRKRQTPRPVHLKRHVEPTVTTETGLRWRLDISASTEQSAKRSNGTAYAASQQTAADLGNSGSDLSKHAHWDRRLREC